MNATRVFFAAELVKHWIGRNVYPFHELTVAKIFNMTKFKEVDHYFTKKHSKPSYIAKVRLQVMLKNSLTYFGRTINGEEN